MCIAIYKDKDIVIPYDNLKQSFESNPDGAGFMYVKNRQLHVQKGFFTFKEFWDAYAPHQERQAVLHFRIKTHGAINEANCHPFAVNKGFAFVHNGVISGFGSKDYSDTYHFNEEIIKPLVNKWGNLAMFEPAIKELVESRISYSKLIFLDRLGNAEIFNENKGVWDQGVWYSNSSYKPKVVAPLPKPVYNQPALFAKPVVQPQQVIQEGQLVYLNRSFYDKDTKAFYNRGEIFEVIDVNSDYTCNIMSDAQVLGKEFVYNVPFASLDFYDEGYEADYTNYKETTSFKYNPYDSWSDY